MSLLDTLKTFLQPALNETRFKQNPLGAIADLGFNSVNRFPAVAEHGVYTAGIITVAAVEPAPDNLARANRPGVLIKGSLGQDLIFNFEDVRSVEYVTRLAADVEARVAPGGTSTFPTAVRFSGPQDKLDDLRGQIEAIKNSSGTK